MSPRRIREWTGLRILLGIGAPVTGSIADSTRTLNRFRSMTHLLHAIRLLLLAPVLLAHTLPAFSQSAVPADPDPARFSSEIAAFTAYDAKNASPAGSILFTGSSSVRMWPTAQAFPGRPVVNRGFGGSHITDLLHYYDELVAPHDPDVIVLYVGDNDVASGLPVERVMDEYGKLLERLRGDFPHAHVVFLSVKLCNSRWDYREQVMQVNRRVRELHESSAQLHYADVASVLLGADGVPDDALFLSDRLHLNAQGYARWNRV
jgi:lysophospholipase L1-like esterase